ncbi:MAG: hypothetical protein ACJ77K_19275 [Bacteroidia bacterium]
MLSVEQEALFNNTVNEKTKELKMDIADVIISLNHIERDIKGFLMKYIKSNNPEFVEHVLLNNQIVSFSSKVKLLEYVLGKEDAKVKNKTNVDVKTFINALHTIMQKRNALAHSDSPLYTINIDILESIGENMPSSISVTETAGRAHTIGKGSISEKAYSDIISEFRKYHTIAQDGLRELMNIYYKADV